MMKQATQIATAKHALELALGKEELKNILTKAKSKIEEIKTVTGVTDEIAIIKTNIKLAKTSEAKAIWILCLGE